MENQKVVNEEVIQIRDYVLRVLRNWRAVVIAALVGAVLLGAYGTVQNLRAANVPAMSAEEQANAQATIAQNDASIAALNEALAANRATIEQHKSSIETNRKTITANNKAYYATKDIIAAYEQQITVWEKNLADFEENLSKALAVTNPSMSFVIEVMETTEQIANHKNAITSTNTNIAAQEKTIQELQTANTDLGRTNIELNAAIKQLEETCQEQESQIAQLTNDNAALYAAMSETIKPAFDVSAVIKQAVIGIVVGIFAILVWQLFVVCTDKHLRNAGELERRFGLFLLSSVYVPACQKQEKKTCVLDRLVQKLAGESIPVDTEHQYQMAAAKVQLLAKRKQLMVTGTANQTELEAVTAKLQQMLPETYRVIAAENFLEDPDAMAKAAEYELVLVEQVGSSETKSVNRLVTFLRNSGISILGAIAV